jgi:hypothetical protein
LWLLLLLNFTHESLFYAVKQVYHISFIFSVVNGGRYFGLRVSKFDKHDEALTLEGQAEYILQGVSLGFFHPTSKEV